MLSLLIVGPDQETIDAFRECLYLGRGLLVQERVITNIRDCHKLAGYAFLAVLGLNTLDDAYASYIRGVIMRSP